MFKIIFSIEVFSQTAFGVATVILYTLIVSVLIASGIATCAIIALCRKRDREREEEEKQYTTI